MADSIWIVLVDTSGSMGEGFTRGSSPTGISESGGWQRKIEAAKDLLIRRISALRTPDVAVIEFKQVPKLLFIEPAQRFPEFVDTIRSLQAGGGTNLAAAINIAAKLPRLSSYSQIKLLVISDGLSDADQAGTAADQLRAANPQATISVLLIDQTDRGDQTAFRVATNDDVTYASSYADVSSAIGGSAADLLAREVGSVALRQRALVNELLIAQDRPRLQTLLFEGSEAAPLTAARLASDIIPVLESMETLQSISDSSRGLSSRIQITNISQTSPVSASVSGIAKAVEVLDERLTPWKRAHAKKMAELNERKLKLEIAKIRAETKDTLQKEDMVRAQVRKTNAEAERLEIENEEKRIKIQEDQLRHELLNLVTDTVRHLCGNSDLPPHTVLQYQTQALKAISAYIDTSFDVRLIDEEGPRKDHPKPS